MTARTNERAVILCVEDEDELRSDLVEELEDAGYEAIEAGSGAKAMERLANKRPDLILCDINMPGLNGYDLLHRLRTERPDLADVPFIFLTALSDPREVVRGKKQGADDYLVKPVDFDLMLATIEARLRQIERISANAETQLVHMRDGLAALKTPVMQDLLSKTYGPFDHVAVGVVLLDLNGKLMFANRAARRLAEGTIDDLLEARTGGERSTTGKSLRSVVANSLVDPADAPVSITIPRSAAERDLLALVFNLENAASPGGPAVAVFIADPDMRSRVPENVLAALFGLTRAESDVATLLAEGRRSEEIATLLGISQTTVAFHVRNLLSKTGTSRQADLMALLLAGPMAISFG